MKKKTVFSLIVLVLLVSCATTVRMQTLAPSQVDLGGNQVIAVAQVSTDRRIYVPRSIPFYVDDDIPIPKQLLKLEPNETSRTISRTAEYASEMIYRALSEGVYRIVDPSTTAKYLRSVPMNRSEAEVLRSKGITMLMDASLDSLDFDEFITARKITNKDGSVYYCYYLVQSGNLVLSYRLYNLVSGKTVDTMVYKGQYPVFPFENETLIAKLDENGKFMMYDTSVFNAYYLYAKILDSFKTSIKNRLVPHVTTLSFSLLSDSSVPEYEELNKLVKEGYWDIAFDGYKNFYESTGDITAGYNYAVLYYALGSKTEALDLVQDIYSKTFNKDIGKLKNRMIQAYESEQKAIGQVSNR